MLKTLLCMHKVRNSGGATMHSHGKLSKKPHVTLNCTKASAVDQEED